MNQVVSIVARVEQGDEPAGVLKEELSQAFGFVDKMLQTEVVVITTCTGELNSGKQLARTSRKLKAITTRAQAILDRIEATVSHI